MKNEEWELVLFIKELHEKPQGEERIQPPPYRGIRGGLFFILFLFCPFLSKE